MNEVFTIGKPRLEDDSMIRMRIDVSPGLEKYMLTKDFYVKYDAPIDADESILVIPAMACILPVAWCTGVDIQVEALDARFASSMVELQREYAKFYPEAPFKSAILADRLVENRTGVEGLGLGFGGGLDCTYSMVQHYDAKPRLIFIIGWDIPLDATSFIEMLRRYYTEFAARAELDINFIETNIQIMNEYKELRPLLKVNFWAAIQQQIFQTGLTAPLSMGRFNVHLTAAGNRPYCTVKSPNSSGINTTEKIGWADLRCVYDGVEDRWNKLRNMKKFLDRFNLELRVCWLKFKDLNCSRCEKCSRTIFHMLGLDMDPNDYGFKVDEDTVRKLYGRITRRAGMGTHLWALHYGPAAKLHPKKDLYGSLSFFEWFRNEVKRIPESPAEEFYRMGGRNRAEARSL